MSYRIEGSDIVISGFEQGIADSPYQGIADMRNIETRSNPGEASVTFAGTAVTVPPVKSAVAYTAQNSGDTITPTGGTSGFYIGTAIVLAANTAVGLSNSIVYYVFNITGTTFQVRLAPLSGSAVVITADGTGTFTTYQYGNARSLTTLAPVSYYIDRTGGAAGVNGTYLVDGSNYAWAYYPIDAGAPANSLIFLGNISGTNASTASGNGVVVWKGWLLLFRTGYIDIANLTDLLVSQGPALEWDYDWLSSVAGNTTNSRISTLVAQDDGVYYTSTTGVGSLLEVAGDTFDPTDANSYTFNSAALAIPSTDSSTCLAELGTNLLVGGRLSFIYPWDRTSTSYAYPLIVPDLYTINIIGTNQQAYIFSGNRGNIYITNGSSIELWKKIPDYLTGVVTPYIRWRDASTQRNQLYFSFSARTNAATDLTTVNGAWAIDLSTNALRMVNKVTNSGYTGNSSMVAEAPASELAIQPPGTSVMIGWYITSPATFGVDVGSSTPYTNYESYIDLDMIPVGTLLKPFTPSQIEWKTSTPLVSGEGVKISYRTNITESFTQVGESTTAGALSDVYQANFQKAQWVQLRVETKSTASTPSYTRLTEVRIRDWPSD